MAKLALTNLVNLQNETTAVNAINANNAATIAAVEKTLSRDGTSPNQMTDELDMNSNRIINLPTPISESEPLRVIDAATLGHAGTITLSTMPPGGNTGQVLEKLSNTSYDANWVNLPAIPAAGLPTGGTVNQVLTKNSSTNYDASWLTPSNAVREVLTTGRTYYVRSDGSNSNNGLTDSPSGAFLTWQKAFDVCATLDFNSQVVTVQHGVESGVVTFTVGNVINTMVGGGQLQVKGHSFVGKTVFNVVAADIFKVLDCRVSVNFDQMTLIGGDLGQIHSLYDSVVTIGSSVHFGTAPFAHVYVHDAKAMALMLGSAYKIDGGANYHIFVNGGFVFHESCTLTLTGTPNFAGAFVETINGGCIQCVNLFTGGAATGPRYFATANGIINTFGQGINIFPGNAAGATTAGGQYIA